MTNLIVKGKEFNSQFGTIDVDFRFYKEDGTPIMVKEGISKDGEEYHAGQISSSFEWAKQDAHNHFKEHLEEQFPDGYLLQFDFVSLNGKKIQ